VFTCQYPVSKSELLLVRLKIYSPRETKFCGKQAILTRAKTWLAIYRINLAIVTINFFLAFVFSVVYHLRNTNYKNLIFEKRSIVNVLTVLFPRFFTLHANWTVSPAKPVTLVDIVASKYGPISGVVRSWKLSGMKTYDPYAELSAKNHFESPR